MSDTFDHYGDALNDCLDEYSGIEPIDDFIAEELGPSMEQSLETISSHPLGATKGLEVVGKQLGRVKDLRDQAAYDDFDSYSIGDECPCGGSFVLRTNTNTGVSFLGCDNFPICRNTETYTEKIEVKDDLESLFPPVEGYESAPWELAMYEERPIV